MFLQELIADEAGHATLPPDVNWEPVEFYEVNVSEVEEEEISAIIIWALHYEKGATVVNRRRLNHDECTRLEIRSSLGPPAVSMAVDRPMILALNHNEKDRI